MEWVEAVEEEDGPEVEEVAASEVLEVVVLVAAEPEVNGST